jgi:hypothetical protein
MWNDPVVEEIRKVRDRLASKLNYDVQALGKYYKSQQESECRTVVTRAPKRILKESENAGATLEGI